jgi:hypothetical protein
MTLSGTSSPPFAFNYKPLLGKSGLKNRPPETFPISWGLNSIGPFDFSPASGQLPKLSLNQTIPRDLTEILQDTHADDLRAIVREAAIRKKVTPEAVVAYAALHLVRDDGKPIEPAPHHRLWLRLLCDERIRKLLIIAPPESAKTTWVISAYLGCRIGIFPQQSVIIGSDAGATAEKRSVSLRAMVVTEAWQETFPGVLPVRAHDGGLKWETTEWSLAPDGIPFPGRLHPTIAAYGTGGAIVGSRGDLVLGDDLLNYEGSRSPTWRLRTEEWAHTSFLSRRKAGTGRAAIIGTSWHPEDYLARARAAGDWVVCHLPMLSDGPEVYATLTYPDKFEWDRLGEPMAGAMLEMAA